MSQYEKVNKNQDRRDKYRRSRGGSDDSCSTLSSSGESNVEESGSKCVYKVQIDSSNSLSPISDDNVRRLSSDTLESPYISSLNLPMIIEEDAEYDMGNTLKLQPNCFKKEESEDSPFLVVKEKNMSNFEDSCELSQMMKSLWSQIKMKN
mmetsp:Transcript_14781/g.17102  ORF Transcript_14781/g.17102 Transcript_14781/m.17102 type:complete len:150 (-) Transcript_14781:49-498(-)